MIIPQAAALARFLPDKMAKADLAAGEQLYAGLNCFEPGQEHAPHTHEGQDKLYVVLEGSCEVTVGEEKQALCRGAVALAASGITHAIRNTGSERLVVMTILAPPPKPKK
jgi:quercetin dioxygenase-like cupin family protein